MQRFGNIGISVIKHYGFLSFRLRDPLKFVMVHLFDIVRKEFILHAYIDKTRPDHFYFMDINAAGYLICNLLRNHQRCFLIPFRSGQRAVALKLAQVKSVGNADLTECFIITAL